jgi:hypothetical protein
LSNSIRFASIVALLLASCSGGADNYAAPLEDDYSKPGTANKVDGSPEGYEGGSTACTPFDKRDCTIDLWLVDGVHNCAKGVQICENGVWTPCATPEL